MRVIDKTSHLKILEGLHGEGLDGLGRRLGLERHHLAGEGVAAFTRGLGGLGAHHEAGNT